MTQRARCIRMMVTLQIRQFFLHRRSKHIVPLLLAGVVLAMWRYWASPFIVIVMVAFSGLEPQFSNMLFRTPHELESLAILPVRWKDVVTAKNIAALILLALVITLTSATILYFTPTPTPLQDYWTATLYFLTVALPVTHLGNRRSVRYPRRITGWQYNDLIGIVEMLINVVVLSIPFLVLVDMPLLCLVYSFGTILFWWFHSIPHTVGLIEKRKAAICLTR